MSWKQLVNFHATKFSSSFYETVLIISGSILSELGYSQSEEDLEVSLLRNGKSRRKSGRPCLPEDAGFVQAKRRRSSRTRKSIEVCKHSI